MKTFSLTPRVASSCVTPSQTHTALSRLPTHSNTSQIAKMPVSGGKSVEYRLDKALEYARSTKQRNSNASFIKSLGENASSPCENCQKASTSCIITTKLDFGKGSNKCSNCMSKNVPCSISGNYGTVMEPLKAPTVALNALETQEATDRFYKRENKTRAVSPAASAASVPGDSKYAQTKNVTSASGGEVFKARERRDSELLSDKDTDAESGANQAEGDEKFIPAHVDC